MAKRALVIEEDLEALRILSEALAGEGWEVDQALSGMAALEFLARPGTGYNCVVAELFMPDMDGRPFFTALRRLYPGLPVHIVTAYGDEQVESFVGELGLSSYSSKPVSAKDLLALLRSTVAGSLGAAEPQPLEAAIPPFGSYLYLAVANREEGPGLFESLKSIDGVQKVSAVKGEGLDLLVRTGADTEEILIAVNSAVTSLAGLVAKGTNSIESFEVGSGFGAFTAHYKNWRQEQYGDEESLDPQAYLMVDIEKDHIVPIYMSVLFTEGVERIRVLEGQTKLMVLLGGAAKPGVVRHLLRKMAQLDGIRRVREVNVVNMEA